MVRRLTFLNLVGPLTANVRSMAALVAAERHLWLTLSDMKEKDRVLLLDTPLMPSGLFGNAEASAVVQRYLSLAAGREQPQPCTSSSYREVQKLSIAIRASPSRDRDHHHQPATPASVTGCSGLQRAHISGLSACECSGTEKLTTPAGVSRTVSLAVFCRSTITGHLTSGSVNTSLEIHVYKRTTYLGMVWDLTTMQACLSPAWIESIFAAVIRVKEGRSLTVKQLQQLLGLMEAASNVIPFGLLHMRPLQWWLKTKVTPRGNPLRMIK
ncbi:hypothetical protein M9458_027779, partial [Cirrhinus mrigala]